MDKKKYEKPTIEINLIDDKDVITTSVSLQDWNDDGIFDGFGFGKLEF